MRENNISVEPPKKTYCKSTSMNSDSSTYSQMESAHSPIRFHSPLRSDQGDPSKTPPFQSPALSPIKYLDHPTVNVAVDKHAQYTLPLAPSYQPGKVPDNGPLGKLPSSGEVFNRAIRENPPHSSGAGGPAGGDGGKSANLATTLFRRIKKVELIRKASMGFRLSEVVFCLISFSVLAADKTPGWSGDSFDRYKEYRYCLSVNVVGFVYSAFQAYDLVHHIATGKRVIGHHLRYNIDFLMDQILAYLLISASSSAATRVDDWKSNWGKDEFTERASAAVGMAFLAFIAFAFSSLISGYNLCTHCIS